MESLSIGQVAKQAGVSARMLRHYDEIGLFRPAEVSANGYRWYSADSLPQLYRILALRRAGLGLSDIADIVADDSPEVEKLTEHLRVLEQERDSLNKLITAIQGQIVNLQTASRELRGLTPEGLHKERSDFSERLGVEFGAAASFASEPGDFRELSQADMEHMAATMTGILAELASLMNAGHPPESVAVQRAVRHHYAEVIRYWPAELGTYARMGKLYETDPLQRWIAESVDPALPGWLSLAIQTFAGGL